MAFPQQDKSNEAHARRPGSEPARLQMADIGRLAGVLVPTVSRALKGSPLINAETRQRIGDLARSLNYSINIGAKNLRLGRIRTSAVVIPYDRVSRQSISDPFSWPWSAASPTRAPNAASTCCCRAWMPSNSTAPATS